MDMASSSAESNEESNAKSDNTEPGAIQAQLLKSLAEPLRIRILNVLAASSESLCICELVDALLVPQYQISRHMAVLKRTGIVNSRKEGVWVYHSFTPSQGFSSNFWKGFTDSLMQDQLLKQDFSRLQTRLELRTQGRCVVGLQSECC